MRVDYSLGELVRIVTVNLGRVRVLLLDMRFARCFFKASTKISSCSHSFRPPTPESMTPPPTIGQTSVKLHIINVLLKSVDAFCSWLKSNKNNSHSDEVWSISRFFRGVDYNRLYIRCWDIEENYGVFYVKFWREHLKYTVDVRL